MWNGLEHTQSSTESQHGAHNLALAVKGDVLQLEEGFGGCPC